VNYTTMYGDDPDTVISRGGSCIVDPFGNFLAGPDYDGETILVAAPAVAYSWFIFALIGAAVWLVWRAATKLR